MKLVDRSIVLTNNTPFLEVCSSSLDSTNHSSTVLFMLLLGRCELSLICPGQTSIVTFQRCLFRLISTIINNKFTAVISIWHVTYQLNNRMYKEYKMKNIKYWFRQNVLSSSDLLNLIFQIRLTQNNKF